MKGAIKLISDAWKGLNNRVKINYSETNCDRIKELNTIQFDQNNKKPFVFGTSITGDDTSLLVDDGKIGLEIGKTSSRFPIPEKIFISHHHEDHINGFPRMVCKAKKEGKKIDIYVANNLPNFVSEWLRKVEKNNKESININFVKSGDKIKVNPETRLDFFKTNHTLSSLGVSIMKKKGAEFENYLTYTGDINLSDPEMRKEPSLHSAKNLITESSYFGNDLIYGVYDAWAHSSVEDVKRLLKERENEVDSITYIHLPYSKAVMQSCSKIESRIKSSRAKDVGYIPTCIGGLKNSMKPRHRVSLNN